MLLGYSFSIVVKKKCYAGMNSLFLNTYVYVNNKPNWLMPDFGNYEIIL